MDYQAFPPNIIKTSKILINGSIVVPSDYGGEKAIIIPDTIVHYCVDTYGLALSDMHIIDPMCGVGTIPRIINLRGGNCIGIEIDEQRYQAALTAVEKRHLFFGDFRKICLPDQKFDAIFTSMPFTWFRNAQSAETLDSSFALRFMSLLKSSGFILLDSIPHVGREGENWPVAELQRSYLEKYGFKLDEMLVFENDTHIDPTSESVIMKFSI